MKILFYGDSNTYGYDPRGPVPGRYDEKKIWPMIAGDCIADSEVFIEALNGRRLPSSDFDFEVIFAAIDRCEEVDVLGIMLGTNDYICSLMPEPDVVAAKMEDVIKKIKAKYPDLRILLIAPPPVKTATVCGMQKYDTTDGRLSKAYEKTAEKMGTYFFDAAKEPLSMAFDGVHLSEDGHRQLGRRIGEYIESKLQKD